MSLLILSSSDINTLTSHLQPQDLITLMAKTFAVFSYHNANPNSNRTNNREKADKVAAPQRISIRAENHTVLFMPARIEADLRLHPMHMPEPESSYAYSNSNSKLKSELGISSTKDGLGGHTAIKIVSVPNHADERGLPATTAVLDEKSGAVRAIVNARKLTALRNAATSLLSTNLIGPSTPNSIVAFGAGKQIEAHLDLHIRHFSSITKCSIINRSKNDRATSLYDTLKNKYPQVTFQLLISSNNNITDGIQTAVSNADIIICATSSTNPLFPSSWVRTGTHIILIGSYTPSMREIDGDLVRRARNNLNGPNLQTHNLSLSLNSDSDSEPRPSRLSILVDSREACMHEAGELIDAQVVSEELVEIGELIPVISGEGAGVVDVKAFDEILKRPRIRAWSEEFEGPISIFKSVGVGIQDVAIAKAMVDEAEKWGIGTVLNNYDD